MVPFFPAMLEIIMTSNDHESLIKIYVNTYQNIYLQAPFQCFEAGSLELLFLFSINSCRTTFFLASSKNSSWPTIALKHQYI